MLCCLKFLYGGTNSSANIAMKLNQNNIQLDTSNMGNNMAKEFFFSSLKFRFLHLKIRSRSCHP